MSQKSNGQGFLNGDYTKLREGLYVHCCGSLSKPDIDNSPYENCEAKESLQPGL